jgi:hypothetical protein
VRISDQRGGGVAGKQVPLAKKRGGITARRKFTGNGGGIGRQRIEIVAHAIARRRHSCQQSRPRERSERVRRDRLGVIYSHGCESVEGRRADVGVTRIANGLRPPLGGDNPKDIRPFRRRHAANQGDLSGGGEPFCRRSSVQLVEALAPAEGG